MSEAPCPMTEVLCLMREVPCHMSEAIDGDWSSSDIRRPCLPYNGGYDSLKCESEAEGTGPLWCGHGGRSSLMDTVATMAFAGNALVKLPNKEAMSSL